MLAALVAVTGARADLPTLYVGYSSADCTFKLTNDAGTSFTTIAPGTYQVSISTPVPFGLFGNSGGTDLAACKDYVQFLLTGPGVSLFTTLDYGDAANELYSETFRAGGTYTLQDDGNVGATRRSFTVASSGSPTPAPPASSTASGRTPAVVFRGVLEAVVSAGGKLTLTRKGKPIGALEAGRYTLSVRDASKRDAFALQPPKGKAVTITNAAYVGFRDLSVTLTPGRWRFFASAAASVAVPVVR